MANLQPHPRRYPAFFVVLALVLLIGGGSHGVFAQPSTITAYQSQYPVKLDGIVEPGEWNDTQMITDVTSGMTFAVKQNGTGLLFLMIWNASALYCSDASCFGGIELGNLNNTLPMGSTSSPTLMILVSQSFKGSVDEFISTGEQTPTSVESKGYATQTVCALDVTANRYTAECYRPFNLSNAAPFDFSLGVGSTVEIAFAVGEFSEPGVHGASNMAAYALTISGTSYSPTASVTSSASSQSTTSISVVVTSTGSAPIAPASPSVLNYSLELATVVVGFTLLLVIVLWRYQGSR